MSARTVELRIPDEALPGDMLRLQTQVGLTELPLSVKMKPGKLITIDIPVEADCTFATLAVGWVKVLREGRILETSKRTITVALPKSARAGDVLKLHSEAGCFEVQVPPNSGPTLDVAVPPEIFAAGNGSKNSSLVITKLLINGVDVALQRVM